MAFAFGIAGTFSQGHWVGPALFIFLLICVLGYLSYFGVKDSAILPVLILLGGVLNDDFHRQIKRFQPVQEIRASLEDLRVRGLDGLPAREVD